MMREGCIAIWLLCWGFFYQLPLFAQTEEILLLTGAGEEEALEASILERFEELRNHPLKINLASRQKLLASGLFSSYQLAVMEEYRKQEGDILSWMELAYLDGFGEAYAGALRPFISFASPGLDTDGSSRYDEGTCLLRSGWTKKGFSEGLKIQYNHRERWETSVSLSNTTGHPFFPIERRGFHWTYYGKYHLDQLIIGDFNARFGQGLALWTGFSMKGLGSYLSFFKKNTGLSPSSSWSDLNLRGIAGSGSWRRWQVSAALAFPGLRSWMEGNSQKSIQFLPLLNLSYSGKQGQSSFTMVALKRFAIDYFYTFHSFSFWGEGAFCIQSMKSAGLAGVRWNRGYQNHLSFILHYYPSDFEGEYLAPISMKNKISDQVGMGLGIDIHSWIFTLDWMYQPEEGGHVLRTFFSKELHWTECFALNLRCTEKYHSLEELNKLEARVDLKWNPGTFHSVWRLASAYSKSWAWLTYWEGGTKCENGSIYGRVSLFNIRNWADRIYVYERDAPGQFNVPAYYGRGWSASISFSRRIPLGYDSIKCYARAGWVTYPWEKEKPGRAELKLQVVYDF